MVVDDLNQDGWLDVVTSSGAPRDSFAATCRSEMVGLLRRPTRQIDRTLWRLEPHSADYDNDGDIDILVLRGAWWAEAGRHPNSLLANDGKGHFRDVTLEVGLGDDTTPPRPPRGRLRQ